MAHIIFTAFIFFKVHCRWFSCRRLSQLFFAMYIWLDNLIIIVSDVTSNSNMIFLNRHDYNPGSFRINVLYFISGMKTRHL